MVGWNFFYGRIKDSRYDPAHRAGGEVELLESCCCREEECCLCLHSQRSMSLRPWEVTEAVIYWLEFDGVIELYRCLEK